MPTDSRNSPVPGFTLVELLVVVAVAAVLLAFAAPQFGAAARETRRTSAVNGLLGTLQLARSEAIKRSTRVVVCAHAAGAGDCGDDWSEGWIAFVDDGDSPGALEAGETILRSTAALAPGLTLTTLARLDGGSTTAPARLIRFGPRGTHHWRGGGTFRFCSAGSEGRASGLNVALGGGARRARRDDSGNVLDAFGGTLDCPGGEAP